ncbi:hypothetical protein BGZ76_011849 [Entomortierella beljakovae]|nr:hypothetical protein BGZ76_011849 [Entomortierella beljakovae]
MATQTSQKSPNRKLMRKGILLTTACCIFISLSISSTVDAKPISTRDNGASSSSTSKLNRKYANYEAIVGSDSMMPTFFDHRTITKPSPVKRHLNTKDNHNKNVMTSSSTTFATMSKGFEHSLKRVKKALHSLFGDESSAIRQTKSYGEGLVQLEVEPTNEQVVLETSTLDTTIDSSSPPTDSTTAETSSERLAKRGDSIDANGQQFEGVDDEGDAIVIPMPDDVHAHPYGSMNGEDNDDTMSRYTQGESDSHDPISDKYHGDRGYNGHDNYRFYSSSSSSKSFSGSSIHDVLICIATALLLFICLLVIISHRVYMRRQDHGHTTSPLSFLGYFATSFFASLYKDSSSLVCQKHHASTSSASSPSSSSSSPSRSKGGHDGRDVEDNNYPMEAADSVSTSFSTHGQAHSDLRRTSSSQHHVLQEQFASARGQYSR